MNDGRLLRAGFCLIGLMAAEIIAGTAAGAQQTCAPVGEWSVPGVGRIAAPEILARAARAQVVLLGESHANPDHHRWQLQTMAALTALRPKIVLGFEMFPRRVQGQLDRWVAGELSEQEFLKASDWSRVWGLGTAFYLPLFHFARLNRMPMIALNVERSLVETVRAKGLDGIAPDRREGVSAPAPPRETYLGRLFESYVEHPQVKDRAPARADAEFQRFVEAQLVWDRAMAQALADAAARYPDALVIGVMGSGHIAHGDGVPHQLAHLGIEHVASLLPWGPNADCDGYSTSLATAVFALPPAGPGRAPPGPRLGITIETTPNGVRVAAVNAGSIAEATGLRVGDVLVEVAGTAVTAPAEVSAIVGSMAPGTWLPLRARRDEGVIEFTAKFPATR